MDIPIWAQAIIIVISSGVGSYLTRYVDRKAENRAAIEDGGDISYQNEKGKNLATQQDIEEITKKIESVKSELGYVSQQRIILRQNEREVIFTLIEDTCLLMHDKLSLEEFKPPYKSDEEFDKYHRDVNNLMTKVEIDHIKLAAYFPDGHALRDSAFKMRNALGEAVEAFNAQFDKTVRFMSVIRYQATNFKCDDCHQIDSKARNEAARAVAEFSKVLNDSKKLLYPEVKKFQDDVRDYFQVDR